MHLAVVPGTMLLLPTMSVRIEEEVDGKEFDGHPRIGGGRVPLAFPRGSRGGCPAMAV